MTRAAGELAAPRSTLQGPCLSEDISGTCPPSQCFRGSPEELGPSCLSGVPLIDSLLIRFLTFLPHLSTPLKVHLVIISQLNHLRPNPFPGLCFFGGWGGGGNPSEGRFMMAGSCACHQETHRAVLRWTSGLRR